MAGEVLRIEAGRMEIAVDPRLVRLGRSRRESFADEDTLRGRASIGIVLFAATGPRSRLIGDEATPVMAH